MNLGKLSAVDLHTFIELIPLFESLVKDTQHKISKKTEEIFTPDSLPPTWCHLYEFPIDEHLARVIVALGLSEETHALASSENPTSAAIESIKTDLTSPNEDLILEGKDSKTLPLILGLIHSLYLSFKSLLTFGMYLNEQIALIKKGGNSGDQALFNAIRIDPSMIGCHSISKRISRAIIENDIKFMKSLRRAFQGKITQRQVKMYELQRLVFQVLLESGAPKLSSKDLYDLFVEQLKIVKRDRNSDIGDVAENLRQYAYQFIKLKSVR